jgi:hypothetical protein
MRVHPAEWAGRTVPDKLTELRKELASKRCDAILLNDLAEIAWLFNLRGSDVDCNPVFVAYALVDGEGAKLFVHGEQVTEEVAAHLHEAGVVVEEYDTVRFFQAKCIAVWCKFYSVTWFGISTCAASTSSQPGLCDLFSSGRQVCGIVRSRRGDGGGGGAP